MYSFPPYSYLTLFAMSDINMSTTYVTEVLLVLIRNGKSKRRKVSLLVKVTLQSPTGWTILQSVHQRVVTTVAETCGSTGSVGLHLQTYKNYYSFYKLHKLFHVL